MRRVGLAVKPLVVTDVSRHCAAKRHVEVKKSCGDTKRGRRGGRAAFSNVQTILDPTNLGPRILKSSFSRVEVHR